MTPAERKALIDDLVEQDMLDKEISRRQGAKDIAAGGPSFADRKPVNRGKYAPPKSEQMTQEPRAPFADRTADEAVGLPNEMARSSDYEKDNASGDFARRQMSEYYYDDQGNRFAREDAQGGELLPPENLMPDTEGLRDRKDGWVAKLMGHAGKPKGISGQPQRFTDEQLQSENAQAIQDAIGVGLGPMAAARGAKNGVVPVLKNIFSSTATGAAANRVGAMARERAGGEEAGVADSIIGGAGGLLAALAAAPAGIGKNIANSGSESGRAIRLAERASEAVNSGNVAGARETEKLALRRASGDEVYRDKANEATRARIKAERHVPKAIGPVQGVRVPTIDPTETIVNGKMVRGGIKSHGQEGINEASDKATKRALGKFDVDQGYASKQLEAAENELMPTIGQNPADVDLLRKRTEDIIDEMTSSTGGELGAEVKNLRDLLRGKNGLDSLVTVEDVVKFRRQLDEVGRMGRMAGTGDRPYRLLRHTAADVIRKDAPGLADAFDAYHGDMKTLEHDYDKLLIGSDGPVGTQKEFERISNRLGKFGATAEGSAAKNKAMEDLMAHTPEMEQPILDIGAVRAREMSRFSQIPATINPLSILGSPPVQMRLGYPMRNSAGAGVDSPRATALGAAALGSAQKRKSKEPKEEKDKK